MHTGMYVLYVVDHMHIYTMLTTCAFTCIFCSAYISSCSQAKSKFQDKGFLRLFFFLMLLPTTGRLPVCLLICVPDCTPVRDNTPAARPLSCPQPAHKKLIPAHVGRNIHYVIITRAIVLTTSCLNQGCQG